MNNGKCVLEYPTEPSLAPDPRGLGCVYFDKLKENRTKIAQIDSQSKESQSYEEVLLESVGVAEGLLARGVTSDDVISLCTYNHLHSFTPILAATYLLVKVASLDPTLCTDEMKYMLELVKPRLIFCVPESVEQLETALEGTGLRCDLVVFGETAKHVSFAEFLIKRNSESDFQPKCAGSLFDTAFIFFSSGTTGLPKGICLNHYGLQYVSNYFRDNFDFTMAVNYTSPYWISHVVASSVIIFTGGCRLIAKCFNANELLEMVETFKVTNILLAPSFTYSLTSNVHYEKYDTSSLKCFLTGGSTIATSQIEALTKVFPSAAVTVGYGLTELSGLFSLFSPTRDADLIVEKRGSSGKMLAGHSCKVVDLETNEILGPNQPGELLIKSKCLMNGYYNQPIETQRCYDEEGLFLRTGDIVYFDEDECLYVVDRIKEMFKYRSWHILPAELENIILTHPAIKEAVIIGYPHEEDGDRPMAVAILKENVNVSGKDIITFFNAKVSERKQLRGGIKFVKKLPKTSTGKYNRRSLRQMILNYEI